MAGTPLVQAIAQLVRLSAEPFTINDLLYHLSVGAAESLPVHAAGVMRVDSDQCHFVHATHPGAAAFLQLQATLQSGPSRHCRDTELPVIADSADAIAQSWPALAHAATQHSIEAVLAVPLLRRGRCWGTLNLFSQHLQAPGPDEIAAAQVLADIAASYLASADDAALAQKDHEQLTARLLIDQLTGLPNRGLLHQLLDHAIATAGRRGSSVAVLFVDLDDFKTVNDTYGHIPGDTVLQEVAQRLQLAVRTSDSVGRLSGDEFLVVCEDLPATSADTGIVLTRLAQRIQTAIRQPIATAGTTLTVTASIGIAITTAEHATATELIHRADHTMYTAKAHGPNAVAISHQPPQTAD